jgi:hypothetical protein
MFAHLRGDECGERCWSKYIPVPYLGDGGKINLDQLITRGNPDIPCLYIGSMQKCEAVGSS